MVQVLQPLNLLDVVGVERQVGNIHEFFQALNLLNLVEAQVEPLQVDQVANVLNRLDDVVVQLQLRQLLHAPEVVDDPDVLIRQLQMREAPNRRVVIVEDLVLLVVLDGVVLDQPVVDDRRLHCLLFLLVVRLLLEDLADVLGQFLDLVLVHLFFGKFKI